MEVDDFAHIPNWVVVRLVESRTLKEELAQEDPLIFYDNSITLHRTNYQKDSRKLLLQHVKVKGKYIRKT